MRGILSACLVAVLVALPACSKAETSEPAKSGAAKTPPAVTAVNAKCPTCGKGVDAEVTTVAFQGHAVGFCCGECRMPFDKMSDTEKVAALAKNGTTLPK